MKNSFIFALPLFLFFNCKSVKNTQKTTNEKQINNNNTPSTNFQIDRQKELDKNINKHYDQIICFLKDIKKKRISEKILKNLQIKIDQFVSIHKGNPIDSLSIKELLNKLINLLPKQKPKNNYNLYIAPIRQIIKTDPKNCNTYHELIKNLLQEKNKNKKLYYKYKEIYEKD